MLAKFHMTARRWLVVGSVIGAGWAAGSLSASCGGTARPITSTPGPASPPQRATRAADIIAGAWAWSLTSESGGVRRVERERWDLRASGRALTGSYDRRVAFLAIDGSAFACSHTLAYEQRARFEIAGSFDMSTGEPVFTLRETGFVAAPSPCDDGQRRLAAYTGKLANGALVLSWPGGQQTLHPADARDDAAAPGDEDDAARGVDGAWRWQGFTAVHGSTEVRIEQERWTLADTIAGAVSGEIARAVTVFDERGDYYACSGDTQYTYRDRYLVRGVRAGSQLVLHEVEARPEPHPCLDHRDRHLDAATGRVIGGYLELEWRGKRRQVLHRAE